MTIPEILRGRVTQRALPKLVSTSVLGAARMEGIYLRREAQGRLLGRTKIVGVKFKQQIAAHWTRRPLIPNHLAAEVAARS